MGELGDRFGSGGVFGAGFHIKFRSGWFAGANANFGFGYGVEEEGILIFIFIMEQVHIFVVKKQHYLKALRERRVNQD